VKPKLRPDAEKSDKVAAKQNRSAISSET